MISSRYPIAYTSVKRRAHTFGSDCSLRGTNTKQGMVMEIRTVAW